MKTRRDSTSLAPPSQRVPAAAGAASGGGRGGRLFEGLPLEITAGRCGSLFAPCETLPTELRVPAETGLAMAVEHVDLPLAAVQFHPESILALDGNPARGWRRTRSAIRF